MRHFTLEELGLVDSERECAFDTLTELASLMLEVPVAALSFVQVDKDRQYFKSRVGLDLQQTPLSHSICKHVVASNQVLSIDDARNTPLVQCNRAIDELGVEAYLGAPVLDPSGEPIASLCVVDTHPHRWTDRDRQAIKYLAACASDAVKHKYEVKEVELLRQEQRDFAFAISHDMKAPLRTFDYVFSEVLEQYGTLFDDDTRQLLQTAHETTARAGRMVDGLLEYIQSDATSIDVEPVDLNELWREIGDTLEGDLRRLDGSLDLAGLPVVPGSRMQLTMLFHNLASNGLKFHKPGTPPRVSVSSVDSAEHVDIVVTDNGIGIPAEHQGSVFKLFERLHHQHEYQGTGVGLALVQRVALNHQGAVSVSSDGASGTAFTVRLPKQVPSLLDVAA